MSWERSEDGWSGYGALATSVIALGAGIFDSYHSASMPCPFWASVCPHRQRGLDVVMSPVCDSRVAWPGPFAACARVG